MRIVVQRVTEASVTISNKVYSSINKGLLLFLGIEDTDSFEDIEWLCSKLINLRIFNDIDGVMNISIKDVSGSFLIVSQFTLHASTKKGNRPSYIKAARPEKAIPLYENFVSLLKKEVNVQTGIFGTHMEVNLVNDGPVTILMDSKNKQ